MATTSVLSELRDQFGLIRKVRHRTHDWLHKHHKPTVYGAIPVGPSREGSRGHPRCNPSRRRCGLETGDGRIPQTDTLREISSPKASSAPGGVLECPSDQSPFPPKPAGCPEVCNEYMEIERSQSQGHRGFSSHICRPDETTEANWGEGWGHICPRRWRECRAVGARWLW